MHLSGCDRIVSQPTKTLFFVPQKHSRNYFHIFINWYQNSMCDNLRGAHITVKHPLCWHHLLCETLAFTSLNACIDSIKCLHSLCSAFKNLSTQSFNILSYCRIIECHHNRHLLALLTIARNASTFNCN